MKYVVALVGCLECGDTTEIRGIYDDLETAQAEHPAGELQPAEYGAPGHYQIIPFEEKNV